MPPSQRGSRVLTNDKMKHLVAWCIALAVVLVALMGVTAFAAAEPVGQTYVTQHYYELGRIVAMSAYRDSVAVLRAKDDVSYLSVMGGAEADVRLNVDPNALDKVHMAYYDGKVLLSLGDNLIMYDLSDGRWRDTNIVTVYESSGMMGTTRTPLTHFDVDERGMLYVCYELEMGWVPIDDVFNDGQLFVGSTKLSQATQTYTSFAVHDGVCYFYRTSNAEGTVFTVDTNDGVTATETRVVAPLSGVAYADGLLCLRQGQVEIQTDTDSTVVLPRADATHGADAYLRDATSMCASYDGSIWRVWVADNGQAAVKVYDTAWHCVDMFGAQGNASGRLDSPTQVAHGTMTVVNDRGNSRTVVLRDGTYYHLDGPASCVATAGDRAYVARGDVVLCYDFRRPQAEYPYTITTNYLPDEVLSVCCDGNTVYALVRDNLYVLHGDDSGIVQLHVEGAVRAKTGQHAGMVYVQTPTAITIYKDANPSGVSLDLTGLTVADFDMDYCGNIYLLTTEGELYGYARLQDGYSEASLIVTGAIQALSVGRDGEVYGLYHSALIRLDLAVRTVDNSVYDDPTWDDPVSVVSVNEAVWGYASPNNYESIVRVPAHTYAMRMATHTYMGEQYYYVEFVLSAVDTVRYERVYIPVAAATVVESSRPEDRYVRYDGASSATGVYPYPSYSAEASYMVDKADATFHVLCVMGVEGDDVVWPWYMVQTPMGVGYVAVDNYVSAQPPYVEVERYYARCVAGKLGEKVAVYVAPEEGAEVVTTLVDGTKVELVAPYDPNFQYTCIRLDDREYYVLTANVTDKALTNGQTFALSMSVVVICAAGITVLLYLLVRKRRVA